jgi:hypothetical protein
MARIDWPAWGWNPKSGARGEGEKRRYLPSVEMFRAKAAKLAKRNSRRLAPPIFLGVLGANRLVA